MSSESDVPEGPFSATIDVGVQWCGITYDVGVKSDGNIGDLKRETYELAGLPSKRQKHMDPESNMLNDEYSLGSLQDPPSTHLIGLNKVAPETYRKHFFASRPECTVKGRKDRLEDFGGSKTSLRKGKYTVGTMEIECLIKYYNAPEVRADLLRSIELMRAWKHPNIVVMENVFKEEGNTVQRLVLSNTIGGSLKGYIKALARSKKEEDAKEEDLKEEDLKEEDVKEEDVILNADGTFTIFFKKMILDLCAVLDEMVKRKMCPINFCRDNLYLKRMDNALPELQILFDNVERLDALCEKEMLTRLCQQIKAICSPNGFVHKDIGTKAFCDFLGKEAKKFIGKGLAKTATHYPINWTNGRKSQYLIDLIPSSNDVRKAINECGIMWPTDSAGNLSVELLNLKKLVDTENERIRKEKQPFIDEMGRLQEERNKIISEENDEKICEAKLKPVLREIAKTQEEADKVGKEITWNYQIMYGHDLVRLARNLWKHFETFPWSIRSYFGDNKDAVLTALEKWCPGVWVLMYNAVGLSC